MSLDDAVEHVLEREREEDLLIEAYQTALSTGRLIGGGSIVLEVSEDVWDYMKEKAVRVDRSKFYEIEDTLWGYPVVKKPSWEGFRIDVVVRKVIV